MQGIALKIVAFVLLNLTVGGGYVLLLERLAAEQDDGCLRWQFQKGRVLYQELRCERRQQLFGAGVISPNIGSSANTDNLTQTELVMLIRWTAIGRDNDGNCTFQAKPLRIEAQCINDGGRCLISYDSRDLAPRDCFHEYLYFKPLLHSELSVTMGSDMKVAGLSGLKIDSNINPFLDSVFAIQHVVEIHLVDSMFGWIPTLPEEKGNTWSRANRVSSFGGDFYGMHYWYTHEGSDSALDTIRVEMTAKYYKQPNLTGTGVIKFDRRKRRLESYEATGWLNRKISVKITDEPPVDR